MFHRVSNNTPFDQNTPLPNRENSRIMQQRNTLKPSSNQQSSFMSVHSKTVISKRRFGTNLTNTGHKSNQTKAYRLEFDSLQTPKLQSSKNDINLIQKSQIKPIPMRSFQVKKKPIAQQTTIFQKNLPTLSLDQVLNSYFFNKKKFGFI